MRDRLMRFMMGRYGADPLNQVIMAVSLALMLLSMLWSPLYMVALVLMILVVFRMFSRNIAKRQAEAMVFERIKGKVARFFISLKHALVGTKTHRYFRCPQCKQQVRVPRGKGKISVHCPKCSADFSKRT